MKKQGLSIAALIIAAIIGTVAFAIDDLLSGQTQIAGVALGCTCAAIAFALVLWEHHLMPHESSIQHTPSQRSTIEEREKAATVFAQGTDVIIARHTWLVRLLTLAGGALGIALLLPLRSLLPNGNLTSEQSVWSRGVRLVTESGIPIKAVDLAINSVVTAFPEGHTGPEHLRDMANAAVMLVRVPPSELALPAGRDGGAPDGFVAYSKVCTHAGCPVSLYRASARQLFCPCHQSTFDVLRNGKHLFGPADRALPRLPLRVNAEGYIEALSDFTDPVGPGNWNRA